MSSYQIIKKIDITIEIIKFLIQYIICVQKGTSTNKRKFLFKTSLAHFAVKELVDIYE